ncbi:OadG family protein [Roseburia sp. MSJ-14]|uniref:OadG family protein n=1 Tax=Roseburia sp. MSJ-14 TaxID=2841514 RepID=UPI001C123C9B|nr:OadG family protein [Roseburia sp. MSJ-14]MBU5472850.1 OadG family protein [Roseburia sp. MSJ-14]
MKKKIALILSLCLMVLGLTACGEDPTKVDYNGYSYDQLKEQVQSTAQGLLAMSDDQIEQYKSNENEQYKMLADMVTRWDDATEDVGKYQKLGDFTITKSGKTLTCEQEIVFKERSVILTFVFTYYNMELDDVTVDPVQTLGEKMANAGLNTLMGMGVVFTVLILISLIIYGFKIFPYLEQKKKKNEKAIVSATDENVQEIPAVTATDDLELVAVIAAAIAASTGTSTDDFVVRSIKRRF